MNQLSAKRSQLAALLSANPPNRAEWRKQVELVRGQSNDIERQLVSASAAFADQKRLNEATWEQVRDALAPGEAAIEITRFRYFDRQWTSNYYYVALVTTPQTRDHPNYVLLGDSSQIEGASLVAFHGFTEARGFEIQAAATMPGASAYDFLWKPLVAAVGGATRLYIAADGVLNTIPLGIICAPQKKESTQCDLMMERYDLRLMSSTKDLLVRRAAPASRNAVLVGNPTFDLSEAKQVAARAEIAVTQDPGGPAPTSPASDVVARGWPAAPSASVSLVRPVVGIATPISRDLPINRVSLPPLPRTGTEVQDIADLMRRYGWSPMVYSDDKALKAVVEQASSPRVLHLATHGFFLADQKTQTGQSDRRKLKTSNGLEDPMLRSGLYFAGADRTLAGKPTPTGLDNGVLTALEASNLNLSGTELVVLSACNTAQGELQNGEGVFGLRRGLQEAGAQSVLMSLWAVPDEETLELMRLFYQKWLAGTEMHEALKEAQLQLREEVKREHSGHDLPYYWGAFILVGR